MPVSIANILANLGWGGTGAVPVIQQQQQNAATQQAIQNYMTQQQQAQSNPTGFAATPPNPIAGGLNSPQGGPVPLLGSQGGITPQGQPPMAGVGALPQIAPYKGPAPVPSGNPFDPWMNAFFGPGAKPNSQSVPAFQNMMKAIAPSIQQQTKTVIEDKRENAREQLEAEKQSGRMELLKQKNEVIMRGQDKNYQARIAAIGARATPAQQAELKAATTEYTQASANYRNAKLSMNSSLEDIDALADKAVAAQKNMEAVTAKIAGGTSAPGGAGPAEAPAKVKINKGEEVRYDDKGNAYVNRNGQAVPAEQ